MADPGWEGVTMRTLGQLLTVSLGLVLVASGVAKALWEAPGWPIASAVLPRQVVSVGTTLLPWVEIGIGLSLISGYLHPATAVAGSSYSWPLQPCWSLVCDQNSRPLAIA